MAGALINWPTWLFNDTCVYKRCLVEFPLISRLIQIDFDADFCELSVCCAGLAVDIKQAGLACALILIYSMVVDLSRDQRNVCYGHHRIIDLEVNVNLFVVCKLQNWTVVKSFHWMSNCPRPSHVDF